MTTTAVPAKLERVTIDVASYIRTNPGCTRSEVNGMVTGSNGVIVAAVNRLIAEGRVTDFGRKLRWKDGAK